MTNKLSVGYFVNWGIYDRKFPPSALQVDTLTHILYAFANISPDGSVILSDKWADIEIHYPDDSWDEDQSSNLYGCFKQLYLLKKANRHLKVLLSIGGWSYSPALHPIVVDPHKRATFVETAVTLLEDLGLDGLDVDYEYPQDDEQAQGYVALLCELRLALDAHAQKKGTDYHFALTLFPSGKDYAGSWDSVAGHHSILESGSYDYRALPLPGAVTQIDSDRMPCWSYDPDTKEMITYDNEETAAAKGQWIQDQGLGGAMFWELSGDKCPSQPDRSEMECGPGKDAAPGPSLVQVVADAMGGIFKGTGEESEGWNWL
ncbi:unnamed protein product, partial [Rhizoctonia solani]